MARKNLSALLMGTACVAAFVAVTLGAHYRAQRRPALLGLGPVTTPADKDRSTWAEQLALPSACQRSWERLLEPIPSGLEGPEQARARAIHRSLTVLEEDCQRSAGGDWERWDATAIPYQEDLKARVLGIRPYKPLGPTPLAGKQGFPLFECDPRVFLPYLYEPQRLHDWQAGRTVEAAARWLKRQGIDLIFVPVPKMTEVYPEYFAEHCPADRVVLPRFRRILRDLLRADVEVVDPLPLLLLERSRGTQLLYQPVEHHWGQQGQAVVARALAERLKRYDFVVRAQAGPPLYRVVEAPYELGFDPVVKCLFYKYLSPSQRRRAEQAQPHTVLVTVERKKGGPVKSSPSPIMLIGDSYNLGMRDMLAREINLPLRDCSFGTGSTQAFSALVRDPSELRGCKVVIWTVCMTTLAHSKWTIPPAVRDALPAPAEHRTAFSPRSRVKS